MVEVLEGQIECKNAYQDCKTGYKWEYCCEIAQRTGEQRDDILSNMYRCYGAYITGMPL